MSSNFKQLLARFEPIPSIRNIFFIFLPGYIRFFREFWQFRQEQKGIAPVRFSDLYPQLLDRAQTHEVDRHYIYHTAWAARILAKSKPKFHVDISSSLYFSVIASAFVPIRFHDFRRVHLELKGLTTDR